MNMSIPEHNFSEIKYDLNCECDSCSKCRSDSIYSESKKISHTEWNIKIGYKLLSGEMTLKQLGEYYYDD
ncbi:hypothetical protein RJ45_06590 [Photobacterium gaetbulicola]|uniref:Uncharacterized protein n=1 Tax=Photobacterium gaetbulicola TaxID=1295392 RepID=A0A0B9GHW9_9GAMM|nr:hypothetical protein RJ45_06590 [Photobacterium gaetbulicola]